MTADEAETSFAVALASGPVQVDAAYGRPDRAWGTIVIAHGAGAGYAHPFLVGFARAMRAEGLATLRFNFPYVQLGRRMPGPAAHSVLAWTAAMSVATERADGGPVWASGKSYGGRMASMAAAEGVIHPAGLIYLGYPLHPPGDPAKARVAHLPAVPQPQLFIEGTNDPFVDPHAQLEDAVASCRSASIAWIDGGGHSFEVKGRKRPADEIGADLAALTASWMRGSVAG
ncbi:dienelactone hydrolase family protein [Microbacterium sp. zg.B48]|uniref:alpha/beta hydrolase family protein n=1 Tax=Microbacterium sp. zg.B48 TaxID=2969408 RepID=UPI00214CEC17|nr:alpha/beta family hydrolase [Microbacterium sp. zg.B48]MCR2762217.1 dienelactone hydrolase family protein [Microbacterium sp. zg.B48]